MVNYIGLRLMIVLEIFLKKDESEQPDENEPDVES